MKRPEILKKGTLIDAEESVLLTISRKDARHAIPRDPMHCAAALACKRQLHASDAVIMRSTLYVNVGTKKKPVWVRYQTPPSLSREIVALDRGGTFEPGTYKLTPFPPKGRLGARPFKNRGTKNGEGKTPAYRHITTNIR